MLLGGRKGFDGRRALCFSRVVEWKPYGPDAALVRFEGGSAKARAIAAWLEGARIAGLRDYTMAFDQVLFEFEPGQMKARRASDLIAALESVAVGGASAPRIHRVRVRYDGEDLAEVAAGARMEVAEVVRLHAGGNYEVAMLGFSPGFPYLAGLDQRLVTPRRAKPRAKICAGAVAIGGTHTGIYSVDGPGGWNVIGHTDVRLFDLAAESFLLRTGDRVSFEVVR